MFRRLRADLAAAQKNDPAAGSKLTIFFTYPGIHALIWHRVAHGLFKIRLRFLARVIAHWTRFFTGIEIHPSAVIEAGVFIDHGMGVVIGETAVVKTGCVLFQGVTLGGTGKQLGKRHPTLEQNVIVYANASVLGNIVVGENSRIGAGAVVLKDCKPSSTLVGVPARVVGTKEDPIDVNKVKSPCEQFQKEIQSLQEKLKEMQDCMDTVLTKKDSTNV